MSLVNKPITYRQTTISFPHSVLSLESSRNSVRGYRQNREFGKDLTNLNLTVCQEYNKSETSGFVKAFESIKENQAKIRNSNTLRHLKKSLKKNQKETEKQKLINAKIPMYLRPIKKISSTQIDNSQMEIEYEPLNKQLSTTNIHEQSVISDSVNYFNNIISSTNKKKNNPQYVYEYQEEIFSYLKEVNNIKGVKPNYMDDQDDINDKMRAILIDWLVDVNLKFKLLPQTHFLTINIIDRFLSCVKIKRSKLQLVGVSALFIACKYEEIYPPELKTFAYITDNAYQKKDVLEMEYEILKTLDFNITVPTPLNFLDFIILKISMNEIKINQIKYLLELSLINGHMKKYSAGLLTVSAALLVNGSDKNKIMEMFFDSFKKEDIEQCIRDLIDIEKNAREGNMQLKAVKNKYSLEKFCGVAKMKIHF